MRVSKNMFSFSSRKLAVIGLALIFSLNVQADQDLEFNQTIIPEGPPVARVLAGYMEIVNNTDSDITIIGAESKLFNSIEFHDIIVEENVSMMEKIGNLVIPANGKVVLQRGGKHLMLFGPRERLKKGDKATIIFFSNAGQKFKVEFPVKEATLEEDHSHHHH